MTMPLGRTDAVWKSLGAYGFSRPSSNKFVDDVVPHPCFENFVRKKVKNPDNIASNGEVISYGVASLARMKETIKWSTSKMMFES